MRRDAYDCDKCRRLDVGGHIELSLPTGTERDPPSGRTETCYHTVHLCPDCACSILKAEVSELQDDPVVGKAWLHKHGIRDDYDFVAS